MTTSSDRTIDATRTSFYIIEEIRRQDGARLSDLANTLDLPKSSVHAHLATLEDLGYVVKNEKTYHVALKFLHFGEYARNRDPRHALARDLVYDLSQRVNEEVDFTVEENGRLISLYHSVGQSNESGMQVGSYFYMHNTAAGKAILAELPRDRVRSIVDKWGLPADTPETITDVDDLIDVLDETAERGYAINDEEIMEGFRSIGAVVRTPEDEIFGAVSLGGPTYRLTVDDTLVTQLLDSIESLERKLAEETQNPTDWWGQYYNSLEQK